jgi:alpha-glucosidase (family GH31 glycosyl hydrolase)
MGKSKWLKCFSARQVCFLIMLALGTIALSASMTFAATMDTVGSVRVSCLSPILVRIEAKNSTGAFEDRPTFMVVNRTWDAVTRTKSTSGTTVSIVTANYTVNVPNNGSAITGVQVLCNSQNVFTYSALPSGRTNFPAPDELGSGYVIADNPRVVPPTWGATPMPAGALPTTDPLYATSGWDYRYETTPDVYIFVNPLKDYFGDFLNVRKDFLKLTGPVPIVPRYFLGFVNFRYQALTDVYAEQHADTYRADSIPLDIYIIDTDWRNGAYDYNPTYFPNPTQFFTLMHNKHLHICFNDHPQGSGTDYQTRWDGLTGNLNDGLDFWWFDRNWSGIITSPVTGIDQEVWGMKMYWDIQKMYLATKYSKSMRPAFMGMRSNDPSGDACDPINQPHPASHRYPGWWTGDENSEFGQLTKSVAASVADGIRLLPHVQHDIAGHRGCNPGDELYTRWLDFGCFSPQPRVHGTNCGEGVLKRYPWEFTTDTKNIVTRYLQLRYRLMAMMYSALRQCYEDGSPLMQRCDLLWPATTYSQAKSNTQYLFGNDILLHPVTATGASMTTAYNQSCWLPPGAWYDAFTGAKLNGSTASSTNVTTSVASYIWHMPMFIRQGAVVVLNPNMQYTAEKPWNPLTLECWLPVVGAKTTRLLYEDDDSTYNYENNQFAKTSLTSSRDASGTTVTINAAQGTFPGQVTSRGWIVRFHLDSAIGASQVVTVNGAPVALGTAWTKGATAQARSIAPATLPNPVTSLNFPIPLQGEGQAPGASAPGPVVEVWVPAASVTTAQTVFFGIPTATMQPVANQGAFGGGWLIVRNDLSGCRLSVSFSVPMLANVNSQRHVTIALSNLKGETVSRLVNNTFSAGYHAISVDRDRIPAGIYLVRQTVDGALRATATVTLFR